ncbi:hypothetical protein BT69DRAFT_1213065 [Atractiella rhizophila]|nr:hypothetical protein BT69DRAFT_1213065 [Atractiella rhizophila]
MVTSSKPSLEDRPPNSPPPPPPPKLVTAPSASNTPSQSSPLTINPFATLSSVFRKLPPFSPTHSRNNSVPSTPPPAPQKDNPLDKEVGKEDEPKFDYQKFLEKMRDRRADGVGKYLRSFLKHFQAKPPRTIPDQIKVINDFLDFIALKMRENDLFYPSRLPQKRAEAEFEINLEAMEKLVLNRLWHLTFTPVLNQSGSTRPPSDDLERDHVLSQRIFLFRWIEPKHLDLPFPHEREDGGWDHYIPFAQRELGNINHYKAPRDKIICVLNCCKVIFAGLIKQAMGNSETGADAFIPILIYIVLKSNPEHLVSNLQFVMRFRNPEKLAGETGYYLSSLNAAISFIETLDWSNLSNISQEEFERNVESAISDLPTEFKSDFALATPNLANTMLPSFPPSAPAPPSISEQPTRCPAALTSPQPLFPNSAQVEAQARAFFQRSTDLAQHAQRTVSKPLMAVGKIFEDLTRRGSTDSERTGEEEERDGPMSPLQNPQRVRRGYTLPEEGMYLPDGMDDDEAEETVRNAHNRRHDAALGTLQAMFPDADKEVVEMVLLSNSGDLGKTIDHLLEMT